MALPYPTTGLDGLGQTTAAVQVTLGVAGGPEATLADYEVTNDAGPVSVTKLTVTVNAPGAGAVQTALPVPANAHGLVLIPPEANTVQLHLHGNNDPNTTTGLKLGLTQPVMVFFPTSVTALYLTAEEAAGGVDIEVQLIWL